MRRRLALYVVARWTPWHPELAADFGHQSGVSGLGWSECLLFVLETRKLSLKFWSRARSLQRIHDASQLLDLQHLCLHHDFMVVQSTRLTDRSH